MDHASGDDPFWKPLDFTDVLDLDIPILRLDGGYDYATGPMAREFKQRLDAGLTNRLHIGPGTHFGASDKELRETVAWFDRHLKKDTATAGSSVSVFVMPEVGWIDLPSWPPPSTPVPWFLQPGGALTPEASEELGAPTAHTYDPSDPTPALGGPSLRMNNCGPVDNRELEARADVLTFTSRVFDGATSRRRGSRSTSARPFAGSPPPTSNATNTACSTSPSTSPR
jgi:putative CocE/NonD family hydrolase